MARFHWLRKKISQYLPEARSALELGCFDGRALQCLPQSVEYYLGYDANWEEGLDAARIPTTFTGEAAFRFSESLETFSPEAIYDLSICMETLEHLPLDVMDDYVDRLISAARHNVFITVPNEQGPVLVLKQMYKKCILRNDSESYSVQELLYGFLGRTEKVERREGGHKGFSYKKLVDKLSSRYEVIAVQGLPFEWLPCICNFSIGIIIRGTAK